MSSRNIIGDIVNRFVKLNPVAKKIVEAFGGKGSATQAWDDFLGFVEGIPVVGGLATAMRTAANTDQYDTKRALTALDSKLAETRDKIAQNLNAINDKLAESAMKTRTLANKQIRLKETSGLQAQKAAAERQNRKAAELATKAADLQAEGSMLGEANSDKHKDIQERSKNIYDEISKIETRV